MALVKSLYYQDTTLPVYLIITNVTGDFLCDKNSSIIINYPIAEEFSFHIRLHSILNIDYYNIPQIPSTFNLKYKSMLIYRSEYPLTVTKDISSLHIRSGVIV